MRLLALLLAAGWKLHFVAAVGTKHWVARMTKRAGWVDMVKGILGSLVMMAERWFEVVQGGSRWFKVVTGRG